MLKLAFASTDRVSVDQHFGAAEGFVVYEVTPDRATLAGVAEFAAPAANAMDGNEDKLAAKVGFLQGCAAVYATAIGASAIRQLVAGGIQPIRTRGDDTIGDLLADIGRAMRDGGVAWVDRAVAAQVEAGPDKRFADMEKEGWEG